MATKSVTGSPSKQIDAMIRGLDDWRGETLSRVRMLIKEADPDVVEEVKWRKPSNPDGVPVWEHDGILCTGGAFKAKVKITFAHGAALKDPKGVFNAGLEGNAHRAIDLHEGDRLNEAAFKALIRAAVAHNKAKARPKKTKQKADPKPKLLSGGNPQIPKGDGDGPVQAYIAAMPDWKQDVGRRLDDLIVRAVPKVIKAVRWNSPFYGVEGKGWFLTFHCFTKYVKVAFLRGNDLDPVPPVGSKDPNARYFHIHEDDAIDERLLTRWVKQSAKLDGEHMF
jgi:hypothetical protein